MKTAIVLGTFDGLHAGHRSVLKEALGFHSVAVTFRIPPKALKSPCLLMMPQDRHQALLQLGINEVSMFEFADLCDLTPKQFLDFLRLKYNPARIVCGFNYRFGREALGDRQYLSDYCGAHGIEFICVESVCTGDKPINSTAIRSLIACGDITAANALLYTPFGFTAQVVSGDRRGRELGFPTINQPFPDDLVVPRYGVYEARVTVDGRVYRGITNIGVRPTFKTDTVGCETYIKDFCGDIYGSLVRLQLVRFIRGEQKFPDIAALQSAIKKDVEQLFDE